MPAIVHNAPAGPARADVLVVGGGPVGLVAANLLAAGGVRTVLVEQHAATSDEAKAISIDDESLRALQRAGLATPVYAILHPGTGTRYYGTRGRPLFHARAAIPYRLGHPFKSPFAQPELERVLLECVRASPCADVRFDTRLEGLTQVGDSVIADLRDLRSGRVEQARFEYLLGCDGGRSTVRRLSGIEMVGRRFEDEWLVVDTTSDPHGQRYAMHHGEPGRPHVVVPGRDGRCRYEFKLRPGEAAAGEPAPEQLVLDLLGRMRPIAPADVERATVYRFNSLVASRWREGRVFLLGDAAHMMPPFAGQGLNSGVRDADNLSWKLASVLKGTTSPALLATYEVERRPHAEAMVRLSTRLGSVVMTSSPLVARVRDAAVRLVGATPAGSRYLTSMRFKPAARHRDGFVFRTVSPAADRLVGTMVDQPRCLDGRGALVLLDDVLGPGFSLVGVGCDDAAWETAREPAIDALLGRRVEVFLDDTMAVDRGGRVGVADADGRMEAVFASWRGHFLLLRPDRYVAAVFGPAGASALAGALRRFVALR
ncbi:MAG TPA: FAD-dependent monooxygenase [Acidimicrobiales bacterium]|nr:FAD-dependent monooxygenase [Acidimicrobiales bacterium]